MMVLHPPLDASKGLAVVVIMLRCDKDRRQKYPRFLDEVLNQ